MLHTVCLGYGYPIDTLIYCAAWVSEHYPYTETETETETETSAPRWLEGSALRPKERGALEWEALR